MSTSGRADLEGGAAGAQSALVGNLEQVREILFGAHYRELARRVARTDAHVTAQAEELRTEMRRRLEALEQHVNKEAEALSTALESQRADQLEAIGTGVREAREAIGLLEQRVKKLEDVTARAQRDFRQQLLDQAKSFIDEVRRMRSELGASVERELSVIRDEGARSEAGYEETRPTPPERPSEAA